MNKDVIYIDVDDDVTAIIGKIKKAKEKIVALVPPKRAGALQSAVNLRLLDRMAKTSNKHLVLITNNQALIALAASAKIPVAKNLQSKPEVAEVAALVVDDGDDIIDGADLPVGDHAKSVKTKEAIAVTAGVATMRSDEIDATDLDIDGETVQGPVAASTVAKSSMAKTAAKKSKKSKIPNFDTFRKRLFLGIIAGVALVALLIWMFIFAPAATVIITARTTPAPVSSSVTLGGTAATDYSKGIVSSVSQSLQKDETVEFEATGTAQVGEKASGTMNIRNCDGPGFTLPAGTTFTASSGARFQSTAAVSVSALSGSASACRSTGAGAGTGSVAVTAAEVGDAYNLSARSYTINGVSGDIYANGSAMSGGSSREVKVISADDVERAQGQLVGSSTDTQKTTVKKQFVNGEVVIDSSFTVVRGAATSTPAVGAEAPASGKATLTIPTTYTIQAVPKADLDKYLRSNLEANLDDKETQKVYSTGVDSATISNYRKDGEVMLATVNATGSIGPIIDEDAIKEEVKGKRYGEVQQTLEATEGVESVDVQFSYFWVRTVPHNTDKITIEFKVQDE
ncbi:MAG: hypothetical protein V4611_00755 [Patescibacteria group bacterium]